MLSQLYIQNYSIIEKLDLSFSQGFVTITGETGAGKSILLGALGLLLGNRADTKVLLNANEKCIVEGQFTNDSLAIQQLLLDNELDLASSLIIRREISIAGKSRAFINDTPVGLDLLKKIGSRLIDIHSQHDTLLLGDAAYQLEIVDVYAGLEEEVRIFKTDFYFLKQEQKRLEQLQAEYQQLLAQQDYNQFVLNELESLSVQKGELESIESKIVKLTNGEKLKQSLYEVSQTLSGNSSMESQLAFAIKKIQGLIKYDVSFEAIANKLNQLKFDVEDISNDLEKMLEEVAFEPQELESLQSRADKINHLLLKNRCKSVDELYELHNKLVHATDYIENLEQQIATLILNNNQLKETLNTKAKLLHQKRIEAASEIEIEVKKYLDALLMPNAHLKIEITQSELQADGCSKISFLFSANKGVPLAELKQVASGGEFARLMLAFKRVMVNKMDLPTIIFDEIDTGVSGEVSIKMGKLIKEMSNKVQSLVITHLPQVAVLGSTHLFVYKLVEDLHTKTHVKLLNEKERVLELAKMISGEAPTELSLQNAKEMLLQNQLI
jgi:DNA repair protein RecN (Recombination protein N)